MNLKRPVIGLLSLGFTVSLVACGGNNESVQSSDGPSACGTDAVQATPAAPEDRDVVVVLENVNAASKNLDRGAVEKAAFAKALATASEKKARLLIGSMGSAIADTTLAADLYMDGQGINQLERDADLECKTKQAQDSFAQLQKRSVIGPNNVLAGLEALQSHLAGVPRKATYVVLIGNLQNNVAPLNLTDDRVLAAPHLALTRVPLDCRGWRTYAVGGSIRTTGGLDNTRNQQLQDSYSLLMRSCGGRLEGYDVALASFPVPGAKIPSLPPDADIDVTSTPTSVQATVPAQLLFDSGSSTLRPGAKAALSKVAAFAVQQQATRVEVQGFTDDVGDDASNMRLSTTRASVVCSAITSALPGIPCQPRGFGETSPASPGTSDAARQANRRVVVILHVTPAS